MAKSREDLVRWSLQKAEEYLQSANENLKAGRLFPAAEEIFRSVETSLEAMLYHFGTKKIEYLGRRKKFTGRLALQFLIRDNLVRTTSSIALSSLEGCHKERDCHNKRSLSRSG